MDDLKAVNDALGHNKGDELLCTLGETLTSTFRSTDAIGRIGGDEFGVALLNASVSKVKGLFSGLQQRLRAASPSRDRSISASIGVAIFSKDIPDIADAIRCADSLMYRAKRAGKGGLVCEEVASFDRDVDPEK